MKRWFGPSRSPIGLDLGSRFVKAVQLAPAPVEQWRLAAVTNYPLSQVDAPLDESAVQRLCSILERQGFTGSDVVVAVPQAKLQSQMMELPPRSSGAPIEVLARAEFARTAKWSANDFEMGLWDLPAPRGNTATQVMAVGVSHADAISLLDLLENQGLNVVALEAQGCALARACERLMTEPGGITAVLDIGWEVGLLVLIRDGLVIYQRTLPEAGVKSLHRSLQQRKELSPELIEHVLRESAALLADADDESAPATVRRAFADHADALIEELELSLSYAGHCAAGAEVKQLLLVGGGARVIDAEARLAERLGVTVRRVALRDVIDCPSHLEEKSAIPSLVTALGLAQYRD